jgi:hypothetical protein
MRLALFILALLILAGCTIPVVGNSPEEIKHRKQYQQNEEADAHGLKWNETFAFYPEGIQKVPLVLWDNGSGHYPTNRKEVELYRKRDIPVWAR